MLFNISHYCSLSSRFEKKSYKIFVFIRFIVYLTSRKPFPSLLFPGMHRAEKFQFCPTSPPTGGAALRWRERWAEVSPLKRACGTAVPRPSGVRSRRWITPPYDGVRDSFFYLFFLFFNSPLWRKERRQPQRSSTTIGSARHPAFLCLLSFLVKRK